MNKLIIYFPIYFCILAFLCLLGYIAYIVSSIFKNSNLRYESQMEALKVKQSMIEQMSFSDIVEIVNKVINFTITNYVILNGLQNETSETLSLKLDDILEEVCTMVEMNLSSELIRQLLKYVTEDYITYYIKNSCRIIILGTINERRPTK